MLSSDHRKLRAARPVSRTAAASSPVCMAISNSCPSSRQSDRWACLSTTLTAISCGGRHAARPADAGAGLGTPVVQLQQRLHSAVPANQQSGRSRTPLAGTMCIRPSSPACKGKQPDTCLVRFDETDRPVTGSWSMLRQPRTDGRPRWRCCSGHSCIW